MSASWVFSALTGRQLKSEWAWCGQSSAQVRQDWYNTFQFAHAYANGEGMKHYTEMVQEPEFAAREKGYTFVSHQQEVGAGYFDDVTTVIQGGSSSVKALTGSTEEEQFH
jgi:isocitrate lyase